MGILSKDYDSSFLDHFGIKFFCWLKYANFSPNFRSNIPPRNFTINNEMNN